MPHGAPDFWGISYRPSLGSAQIGGFARLAIANDTIVALTITGNGIVYGGHAYCKGTASQRMDEYHIYVDGIRLGSQWFEKKNTYQLTTPYSSSLYELRYDDVNFEYAIGIMPNITFETSLELRYRETQGNTPLLRGEIYYTLI